MNKNIQTELLSITREANIAIINGDLLALKNIISRSNLPLQDIIPVTAGTDEPQVLINWMLQQAAKYQQLEMVEYLIPLSDPKSDDSRALKFAISCNNQKMVNLLLPHSDVSCGKSFILQMAVVHDNHDLLKRFVDQCNAQDALEGLKARGFVDQAQLLQEYLEANTTKKYLQQHITVDGKTKRSKKI